MPTLGAKNAPKMGHPDLWWSGEKRIPRGNDRKKCKSNSKSQCRDLSAASAKNADSGRDDSVWAVLFALVGELLLGFEEAAEAVQGAGFAENYQAFG